LGQGGMATVYLAERADGQFEQTVALKVLYRPGCAEDVAMRFAQERQILASLNHPNIAHLVDGGLMPSGQPYVALEYVDGVPVDAYCDRERLDIRQRLALFMSIASAVGHAHRNLVIHRDIKPSNILVTAEGVPKLLDFGIAKLVDASLPHAAPETRSALHPMTPEYASPEQVRGEALTTASDIYQLGYLLYRLLARVSPYRVERGNYAAMIGAICKVDPVPPSQVAPDDESGGSLAPAERRALAGDLDTVVLRALRKEPEARYRSAESLADDIGRHLQGLPVTARQGTAAYRVRKFIRRHRFGVATSLAFASLAAGFAAVYAVQASDSARRLAQERDAAQLEAAKALQVTDFLMSLFEASDPRAPGAGEATAREILARGLARIDALGAQPQVQAQMLDVIGQVYRRLGDYDEAQRLLERAVATWRAVSGEKTPELAASLSHLGRVLDAQGEYAAALALYR
ncbi:MAG: protein kinase domain-containing protein, partial [Geminicoccales bacterium]